MTPATMVPNVILAIVHVAVTVTDIAASKKDAHTGICKHSLPTELLRLYAQAAARKQGLNFTWHSLLHSQAQKQ